jgi:hypothetical protein
MIFEKGSRLCSMCGSSSTLVRLGRYERWYIKDGHTICAKCYGIQYRKTHPDQGRNWRRNNKEYVNAYQRKYRAAKKKVVIF